MFNRNALIFIYGPMCSGKTLLANNLSQITGWVVVDSDEVMSRIHPNSSYDDSDRADMYKETFLESVKKFDDGKSVIVSCAFTNEKYIALLRETDLYEKITLSVLLQVSPEVAVIRWLARKNNPKIQTKDIVYQYASKSFPILPNNITVNASLSSAQVLDAVKEHC